MVNKAFIIAGEPSGDLYAGRVVNELKKMNSSIQIFGVGGEKLKAEGVNLIYHINQMSFMGFVEVITHLRFIKKVMVTLVESIKKIKPDVVILIDYPGFNLKLASKIKKYCNKIIYYISPQLWAWGKNRIKKVKSLVDKMIVIFPFEKDFYKKYNVNVDFVGHPILEIIGNQQYQTKIEFEKKYGFNIQNKLVAVFPGSRKQEIKKHLKIINNVLIKLLDEQEINIAIAVSSNIPIEIYKSIILDNRIKLIVNDQYNLLKNSDLALVKSGTTTIETACFEVPMIIFYKTSIFSYLIGKLLVKIDSFGMVNIIAGKKIVPELLQNEVNEENILKYCRRFLSSSNEVDEIKQKLRNVKSKLGSGNASKKAAEIIYNFC